MDISSKLAKAIRKEIFLFFLSLILPSICGYGIGVLGAYLRNSWLIDVSNNELLPYVGLLIYGVSWSIRCIKWQINRPEGKIKPPLELKFHFHSDKIYTCSKCQKQIPDWVVKYLSKDERTYCEAIDNYATSGASITHINCSRPPLTEGTQCIICNREMGKRDFCDECLRELDEEKKKHK